MGAPACRDCAGDGELFTGARFTKCERCGGAGIETCGECNVGSPPARVVAAYVDTCADGSTYESQVCTACARRLCGLIDRYPCHRCGWIDGGEGWGFVERDGSCAHVVGERSCDCCSRNWYRLGADDTHDYSWEGDPGRYVGGPAKETCPECVMWLAYEEATKDEPRVTMLPLVAEPPVPLSALAALIVGQLGDVRPEDADGYMVLGREGRA